MENSASAMENASDAKTFLPASFGPSKRAFAIQLGIAYAAIGAVGLAVLPEPKPSNQLREYVVLGVLFGIVFGHTTCANFWGAFGGGRHWLRAIAAFSWLAFVLLGLTVMMMRSGGGQLESIVLIFIAMAVQSFLIQIPLWICRITYGVRIATKSKSQFIDGTRMQFGIGHMLILTAVIALLLGVGQGVIRIFGAKVFRQNGETAIFLYLAVAAIFVTLPILVAALLERRQVLALFVGIAFVALASYSEYPLMVALGLQRKGPDFFHVLWINVFATLEVLIYGVGLRLLGFRLLLKHSAGTPNLDIKPS